MLVSDTIICNNCENEIDWYYQIPQKITSGILSVDKLPNDKAKAYYCHHIGDNIYTLSCTCPKCYTENTFTYFSDYKLHIN